MRNRIDHLGNNRSGIVTIIRFTVKFNIPVEVGYEPARSGRKVRLTQFPGGQTRF